MQEFNISTSPKWQKVIYKVLGLINRWAHFIDVIILFVFSNWLYNVQFSESQLGILIYAIPIIQIIIAVKYELKVHKSNNVVNHMLSNYRVILFEGAQGLGKSSFCHYMNSHKMIKERYTNCPVQYNGNFSYILKGEILNLDVKVNDYSSLQIDEATLYFHNINSMRGVVKDGLKVELYSQEVLDQLVRHFFDGHVFYMSVDCNRLPQVIKENAGMRLQMLERGDKTISFITTPICLAIAKLFKIKLHSGLQYWDMQQFVKIPVDNYNFDLSTQDKSQDSNKYANLLRIYAFNDPYKYTYNDRFMNGIYHQLPQHTPEQWQNFEFNRELLKQIGYGEIVNFFDSKKIELEIKQNANGECDESQNC